MEIIVRKMQLSDISFVYEEELKIFGKSLGEKTLFNEIIYNEMSKYFIVTVDHKLAGYVGSWLTIPNAEILNLFVIEEYRGMKLGNLLMNEVIKTCIQEKIDMLTLEVRVSNHYAISMYHELGFVQGNIRKKYYSDGEDALLLMLQIGGKA